MDSPQLGSVFADYKRILDTVLRLHKNVTTLDGERKEKLPALKDRVSKLEKTLDKLQPAHRDVLAAWLHVYSKELMRTEDEVKRHFGLDLEQQLQSSDLPLSGQYPTLRAGIYTLILDHARWRVTIWYGPKQEKLEQVPLSTSAVVATLRRLNTSLGSSLQPGDFVSKLQEAYRIVSEATITPAPIHAVHTRLSQLLTSSNGYAKRAEVEKRGYTPADFSYDLYRLRKDDSRPILGSGLHLIVATRARTKRKQDFLWVPNDPSGTGTTYSHLEFKGVLP